MTIQNKTETKNRNNRMERFVKRSTDILVSATLSRSIFSPICHYLLSYQMGRWITYHLQARTYRFARETFQHL